MHVGYVNELDITSCLFFVFVFASGGPRHMSHYRDLDRPNDEEF